MGSVAVTGVSSFRLIYRKRHLGLDPNSRRRSSTFAVASCRGRKEPDYEGKLVDQSMIVLRMRIREMEISESGVELPSDWMDWERQHFQHYNADVCEAMAVLQGFFMNVRPSLGVGMVALVLLTLPVSTGLTFFHALLIAQGLLTRFNPIS